ncbi:hypothetical protein ACFQMA_20025 [Halosimplex aquaticum]|uniref:Uncharacterized protein n=1 Tax=Halosimplex aquaticum TaxID=3026162 RepID=A0ABD5Y5G2_9EURY|nr:hypothetical protein [Halosimplex aquaticum]
MSRLEPAAACWLAALVVVGTLAAVVPAGATATAPSTPSAAQADAQSNSPYGTTVPLALTETDDGATVVGGVELPENYSVRTGPQTLNGSLVRVDGDKVDWTRTFSTTNMTTQVSDVAVDGDGDVYALVTARAVRTDRYPPETTVEVVHLTSDGDVTWRHELNASAQSAYGATGDTLRATDQGVAVAFGLPGGDGVRLAELSAGGAIWSKTYGVQASPTSLRKTHDGFLVAGNAGYSNPWVLRTGESGQVQFNRTVRGAVDQRVVGAVPTDDGGALLAGTQSGYGGSYSTNAWVSRVDDEGVTRWSRLYGVGNESRVQQVFTHRNGVMLLEQGQTQFRGETTVRLRGVDGDGSQLFDETAQFNGSITAADRTDGDLRLVGVTGLLSDRIATTTSTVAVPETRSVDRSGLQADVGVTSNETAYRGQNLRIADGGANGATHELVKLPDETDFSDPHVVRRLSFDDGETVLESATLPAGEYVLRNADGESLVLDDGQVAGTGTDSEAAFTLASQDFFHLETNRTFVDAAAGESGVSLSLRSERPDYDLHVSVEDNAGESVSAEELREAFGEVDGFDGVERVGGQPVAAIEASGDVRMNVSAAAFDAGLYEVDVSAVDTREAGASASSRLVVAQEANRTVGLSLNRSSLTVPVNGTATANLTLSDVDNGITAMSVSANRTGDPAVWPDLRLHINASRISAGAGGGSDSAEASATAFDGNTANGTVTVGTLGVETDTFSNVPVEPGNNTITLRVDWVVDEDGIPYAVPDPITVPVEVVESTNETDGEPGEGGVGIRGGDGDSDEGSGSGSSGGSSSGGSSSGGSDSSGGSATATNSTTATAAE